MRPRSSAQDHGDQRRLRDGFLREVLDEGELHGDGLPFLIRVEGQMNAARHIEVCKAGRWGLIHLSFGRTL